MIWPEVLSQAPEFSEQVDGDLKIWWQASQPYLLDSASSIDMAVAAGALAPSLAHAFVAGYRCALERLLPNIVSKEQIVSFCVSESGGTHPRAILTTLRQQGACYLLNGQKTWSTLAPLATTLLVAASIGQVRNRQQIKIVCLAALAEGVEIIVRPAAAFLPNVPHGIVTFKNTVVQQHALLVGDGYADFIKPFRSIEDLYITAAALGYIVRWARQARWPAVLVEQLTLLISAAIGLDGLAAQSSMMHLGLAELLDRFQLFLQNARAEIAKAPSQILTEWQRDTAIFSVAAKVRALRRQKAQQRWATMDSASTG